MPHDVHIILLDKKCILGSDIDLDAGFLHWLHNCTKIIWSPEANASHSWQLTPVRKAERVRGSRSSSSAIALTASTDVVTEDRSDLTGNA